MEASVHIRTDRVSFPVRARNFLFSSIQTSSGAHLFSYSMGTRDFFLEDKETRA
jgi:hypothetical protein